jgi:hypothetical protein
MTTLILTIGSAISFEAPGFRESRMLITETGDRVVLPFINEVTENDEYGWQWAEVERPGRWPIVAPIRLAAHQLKVSVTCAYPDRRSIEPILADFRRIARSNQRVRLNYGPSELGWWRMQPPSWPAVSRNERQEIVHAQLEFTLIRAWQLADDIPATTELPKANPPRLNPVTAPKATRVYTVVAGDTLPSIAEKELGDRRRWTEIADLNRITDPSKIKPGLQLLLPADALEKPKKPNEGTPSVTLPSRRS